MYSAPFIHNASLLTYLDTSQFTQPISIYSGFRESSSLHQSQSIKTQNTKTLTQGKTSQGLLECLLMLHT